MVKAMRLPQAEKEKKNRQLLRLKDAQELPSFQFRLHCPIFCASACHSLQYTISTKKY